MMQLPSWDGFLVFVLRYLSDGAVRGLGEIRQGVADLAALPPPRNERNSFHRDNRKRRTHGWRCPI